MPLPVTRSSPRSCVRPRPFPSSIPSVSAQRCSRWWRRPALISKTGLRAANGVRSEGSFVPRSWLSPSAPCWSGRPALPSRVRSPGPLKGSPRRCSPRSGSGFPAPTRMPRRTHRSSRSRPRSRHPRSRRSRLRPGQGTARPGNHTAKPGNHTAKPGNHTAKPGNHTAKPGQPHGQAGQPHGQAGQPHGQAGQPHGQAGQPTAKPATTRPSREPHGNDSSRDNERTRS